MRRPRAESAAPANRVSTPSGRVCSTRAAPVISALRSAPARRSSSPRPGCSGRQRSNSAASAMPMQSRLTSASAAPSGEKARRYQPRAVGRRSVRLTAVITPAAKPMAPARARGVGFGPSASNPPSPVASPANRVRPSAEICSAVIACITSLLVYAVRPAFRRAAFPLLRHFGALMPKKRPEQSLLCRRYAPIPQRSCLFLCWKRLGRNFCPLFH